MPIQLRQRLIVATLHPATDKTKAHHPLTSGVFLVKASSTLHVCRLDFTTEGITKEVRYFSRMHLD